MTMSIDIDEEVFDMLKSNAEVFVDSPNTVLRRLLGLGTNGSQPASAPTATNGASAPIDPPRRAAARRTDKGSKPKRTRAASGTLLPEPEYEMPILSYLAQHDGRAPSREVIDAIGEELADRLTEADREPLNSGEIRWKSRATFARLRMVERGDLDGLAPRGTWQITDQGRERFLAAR